MCISVSFAKFQEHLFRRTSACGYYWKLLIFLSFIGLSFEVQSCLSQIVRAEKMKGSSRQVKKSISVSWLDVIQQLLLRLHRVTSPGFPKKSKEVRFTDFPRIMKNPNSRWYFEGKKISFRGSIISIKIFRSEIFEHEGTLKLFQNVFKDVT